MVLNKQKPRKFKQLSSSSFLNTRQLIHTYTGILFSHRVRESGSHIFLLFRPLLSYLSLFYPSQHRHISDLSQIYTRFISSLYQLYLKYVLGIYQAYFRYFSDISQAYLKHILDIFQVYLTYI